MAGSRAPGPRPARPTPVPRGHRRWRSVRWGSPSGPRMGSVELGHLLPEWQEILGMPSVPATGSGEPTLVDPAPVATDDRRPRELVGRAGHLAGPGRHHLPHGFEPLQDEIERRVLEHGPGSGEPIREQLLVRPRPPAVRPPLALSGERLEEPHRFADRRGQAFGVPLTTFRRTPRQSLEPD